MVEGETALESIRHNLPACKERARVVEQNVDSRGGVEQGASERNNLIAVGEIRIVHLSGDAGYPGAQARKCRLSSVAVATDEHEPGTERTESCGSFQPNPASRSGDNAGLALHVFTMAWGPLPGSLLRAARIAANRDKPQRVTASYSRPPKWDDYASAFFTRSGVIGVSLSRTWTRRATALAIAGATSGVAI